MNPKTTKILLASLLLNILIASITIAGRGNRNEPKLQEALADSNSISLLGDAKDIAGLKTLAEKLEKKWSQEDPNFYVTIVQSICRNFDRNESYELQDKYAKMALDKLYNLPKGKKVRFQLELSLLWDINNNIFNPYKHINSLAKEKDWPEKRLEAARYYFRVWERLEKDIDPNWDPNDRTKSVEYPKPPAGYTGPGMSGMSPDFIEDPKLRAEYEVSLKKYWEIVGYNTEQASLRRLQTSFDMKALQNKILKFYSGPTFDSKNLEVDALKQDLEKCIKDEKIRATILDELKKRPEEKAIRLKNMHAIPEEMIIRDVNQINKIINK